MPAHRIALVGGGAGGIGRATAQALVARGDQVVLFGRRAETLTAAAAALSTLGGAEVSWLVHDLADPGAAAAALDQVERRHGPADVLVLNAGGPRPGRVLDIEDEQWRADFELLVLGPLRLAALALPRMAARRFGRAIFVTSTAVRQPQPDLAASVVLRSAVTSAAKLLSREFADHGVTVNCVAPGPTATARRAEILAGRAAGAGLEVADMDAQDTAVVPAGRAARPEEIAAAITFLASAEASYVNGTVLTVDGGRTETV